MHIDPIGIFAVACVSAVAFAFVASQVRQSWWVWAVCGGLAGLVVATMTIGIAHAVSVPYTAPERSQCYLVGYVVAAIILAVIAACILFRMRRHNL